MISVMSLMKLSLVRKLKLP